MSFESVAASNFATVPGPPSTVTAPRPLGVWPTRVLALSGLSAASTVLLSLLTWSASDPSLMHATAAAPRNLLGPHGAMLADLLMQMLGMASVLVALPLLYWSLQIASERDIPAFKRKLALAPLAVLMLACAASALPTAASWPLRYGFGGVMGDLGLNALANLLATVNPARAKAASGLFFFAAGTAVLLSALGLKPHELADVLLGAAADRQTGPVATTGLWRGMFRRRGNTRSTLSTDPFQSVSLSPGGSSYTTPAHPSLALPPRPVLVRPQPAMAAVHPGPPSVAPYTSTAHLPVFQTPVHLPPAPTPAPPHDAMRVGTPLVAVRDPAFDTATDHASRSLAARFAPDIVRDPLKPSVTEAAGHLAGAWMNGMLGGLRRIEPRRTGYQPPPVSLLSRAPGPRRSVDQLQTAQRGVAAMLTDVLADFGIKGEMRDIRPGPVVTLFEFEPARGTKTSRVISLADDIARHMSAAAVRIAVVPGRSVIGIELPNMKRETVELREMLETDAFRASEAKLPVTLGKTIGGEPIVADLARMPHLLVAGTTGSGKSVGVNAMILSLLYRLTPAHCRFVMIDPKMLELSVYNGIPHLLAPVVTDPNKAVSALNWVVGEMEERYRRMARLSVRNIDAYNGRVVQAGCAHDAAPMPYIVVVVDEFADLMAVAGKDIEVAVQRIAQMARAAGIHLIMATQRPSVDIVTGTIKANFPTRMSFRVASKIDSRTILNETGAEQLLGQGDMLYAGASGPPVRLHAPFVSDSDVEAVANHLKRQAEPVYASGLMDDTPSPGAEDATTAAPPTSDATAVVDNLYDRAIAVVLRDQKASTSYLQRRLQIGYNRAADLMERMERDGIVGPANHAGKRTILCGPEDPAALA